jgi:hypothetical protein
VRTTARSSPAVARANTRARQDGGGARGQAAYVLSIRVSSRTPFIFDTTSDETLCVSSDPQGRE